MGKLLREIDRIVRDAEEAIEPRQDDDVTKVDDIMKHIENVEAAADFIDAMTPGENGDDAFDAEIALRKALGKMRDLSDAVYKDDKKNDETEEEEEPEMKRVVKRPLPSEESSEEE
jgi:hypothetical protein